MTEQLLQFIWQFRYFNPHELLTETGERLQILSPGERNTNQGPDFLQAEIRIDDTVWIGNIELHLLTSGWERHAHAGDRNYDNVILHVVWENDRESKPGKPVNAHSRAGKNPMTGNPAERNIPLLVLQHRVPKLLLGKYEEWMKGQSFVPCAGQLSQTGEALWSGWKQQLLIRRLQRRTLLIAKDLQQNRQHWEETAWWLMARNFGIPVNTEAFGSIAQSLPLRILSRHRHRPEQLEALLLGQAGLLEEECGEGYPKLLQLALLQEEFRHLRGKYNLPPIHAPMLFMRMRPANFPAVRLLQLAGLLHRSCAWFGRIREAASVQELMDLLDTAGKADPGWPGRRQVTTQMKENILINTFLPLLFAYGSLRGEGRYRERALRWMQELRPEKNNRTAGWVKLGVSNRHAADSQALLELKTCYCDERKCLECAIGKALLGAC